MRTLKIGLVFDDSLDKPDGVQQFVLLLGDWLTAQGYDVHYLVGQTARSDIKQLYSLARNVKVRFNHNRMAIPLPAAMAPIRAILAQHNFDVLHVQVPYSPFLAGKIIAAAGRRTAVVGTFHIAPHGRMVSIANRGLGLWVRKTLRRFDAMTATSAPAAAFAKQTFKIDSQVVANPVRLSMFAGARPFPQYAGRLNVVFLGRLVERKGCQYLLAAVAELVRAGRWPEAAQVVICGKGPLDAQLHRQAQDAGIADITEFVGFIADVDKPRYLAAADVAVYPSTGGESFGIVLLEAMAAARGAVLAGDNPGYASVMAPRPHSLFDPHNTAVLADKIAALLADASARTVARDWQRQYVKQFDITEVGRQFIAVYEQALHKRRQ